MLNLGPVRNNMTKQDNAPLQSTTTPSPIIIYLYMTYVRVYVYLREADAQN